MVELVVTHVSGACGRNPVWVRVPPSVLYPDPMPNLLFIEDNNEAHTLMGFYLRGTGWYLHSAFNAEEGLNRLHDQDNGFDAILLDVFLPEISGIEFLAQMRQKKQFDSIPVILSSGVSDPGQLPDLNPEHYHFFLAKPYSKQKLQNILSQLK